MSTAWIEDWFSSDYYSLLYKHRDTEEAQLFLSKLIEFLPLQPAAKILDCGCGNGRHAVCLSKNGFRVTGIDISQAKIEEAQKNLSKNLEFFVHDARNLFRTNYYDLVLSLFTSFGYYDNDYENNKVIRSVAISLKKDGLFVLDFMNVQKEIKHLVQQETFDINKIEFCLHRYIKNACIVKDIQVSDNNKQYHFRENVRAYTQENLEDLLNKNKIEPIHVFGDYKLSSFSPTESNRLIMVGRKK